MAKDCERRRWRRDMVKLKYFVDSFSDGWWVTQWICREHLPDTAYHPFGTTGAGSAGR
jgi:hypothetical protein